MQQSLGPGDKAGWRAPLTEGTQHGPHSVPRKAFLLGQTQPEILDGAESKDWQQPPGAQGRLENRGSKLVTLVVGPLHCPVLCAPGGLVSTLNCHHMLGSLTCEVSALSPPWATRPDNRVQWKAGDSVNARVMDEIPGGLTLVRSELWNTRTRGFPGGYSEPFVGSLVPY